MECFALISQVNVDKESVGKRRNGDTKSSVLVSTILHTNTGKTQNVPIKEVLYIEKKQTSEEQGETLSPDLAEPENSVFFSCFSAFLSVAVIMSCYPDQTFKYM